jgi:flagellar hook-associated protein 2
VGGDDVQDFLDEIETVLGLGAGSATIEDGKVVVTDDTAGESSLSVSLTASGLTGTLDFGHVDEVRAGSEVNTAAAVNITESTDFTLIDGATATDATSKVAISGLTHNGGSVSGTYTYATGDTVQEFLDEIESVFSLTAGSATIKDGRLFVTDDTEGTSFLSITLVESDFGDLDFGAVSVEKGRERQLQAGQDATLKVNNISISNSSNTVTSVIEGVTLNLLDTNANTGDSPVTISVDRNNSAIESTLQTFVDNYNAVRTFINDQFEFDTETSTAGGLLFGDTTLRSIQTQLQRVLSSTVTGLSGDFDNLVELGITADREGLLSINSTTLQAALVESVSEVADVFVGKGTTSDADITFIGFTEDTAAGTYNVNITTAPTQATVAGTVDLEATPLVGGESIKITDTTSSAEETITFSAGDKIGDIVTAINNALGSKVAEVHVFDTAQTGGSGDLTASDTFAQVDGGAGASDNDTITISGTTQNGSSVSSTYTIQTANTLQDFLNAVAGAFNNEVTAELVNGKLQVTENTAGASSLAATITYNGGGTLNFGAKDSAASTEGRNEIAVTASNDGSDQLVLTHDDYGSGSGFTVEEGAGGDLTALGLPNAGGFATITAGLDVAGTINGETATGSGRLLTGDTDNANTDGLRLQVNPSVTGAQGTVTVSLGIGELMDRLMDGLRDTLDGTITNKLEAFDTESDVLQDRISRIEERLARFEARLKSQFLAMEQAMAQIQSQGNFLLSQLGVSG